MNTERLLKLADYLENLPEGKFRFGLSVGYALSKGAIHYILPDVFPELVCRNEEGEPVLKDDSVNKHYNYIEKSLFDINGDSVDSLFYPGFQSHAHGKCLRITHDDAPVEDVVWNLRKYARP